MMISRKSMVGWFSDTIDTGTIEAIINNGIDYDGKSFMDKVSIITRDGKRIDCHGNYDYMREEFKRWNKIKLNVKILARWN